MLCSTEFWNDWHDDGASLPQAASRTYNRCESKKLFLQVKWNWNSQGITCGFELWKRRNFYLYLFRACSLVSSFEGSRLPVSRFTFETGFFNNSLPTLTRLFRFSFVEVSTVDTVPLNVSSCKSSVILRQQLELWLSRDVHFLYLIA